VGGTPDVERRRRAERGRVARRTGRRGERLAARALRARGWRVLGTNVRTPRGEIDLLALDGETVVVVEVKTRRAGSHPAIGDRVDHAKRRRLAGAWASIATRRGLAGRPWRFDVVEVDATGSKASVAVRTGAFRAGR
jgi:putative endonuclease